MQRNMKKFSVNWFKTIQAYFHTFKTPQNTPNFARKGVEKFPNLPSPIKVFIFNWERLESNLSKSKWICS